MDANTVSAIAEQVVRHEILFNVEFYLLMLGLTFVGTWAGSFVSAYGRKRGEALATHADMVRVLNQLEQTTKAAESIKSAISVEEWSQKEYRSVRRMKLEELMNAVMRLQSWLDAEKSEKLFDGTRNAESSPIGEVELLCTLYFPELDDQVRAVRKAYIGYQKWILKYATIKRKAAVVGNARLQIEALDQANDAYESVYSPFLAALSGLEPRAREVMYQTLDREFPGREKKGPAQELPYVQA